MPCPPRRLRAAFFDLDDTLTDSRGAVVRAVEAAAALAVAARPGLDRGAFAAGYAVLGAAIIPDLALLRDSSPARRALAQRVLARCGVDDAELAPHVDAAFYAAYRAAMRPTPGALAALRRTRGRMVVGVITNGPSDMQRATLSDAGLDREVDHVVISADVGLAKPDPAIFHLAARLAGCGAEETAMVGDDPHRDIAGIRAAGGHAVWFNPTGHAYPSDAPPPDAEIRSLRELATVLPA